MGYFKQLQMELEEETFAAQKRKLAGYRKMLINQKQFDIDCPNCNEALSFFNAREESCLHCGIIFPWKKAD